MACGLGAEFPFRVILTYSEQRAKEIYLSHQIPIFSRKMPQYMVNQILSLCFCSCSHPDPQKFLGSQMSNDILDPVVAPCAAFFADPQMTIWRINIILV